MIQCLILDDEPLAREVLQTYLDQTPGFALAGSFGDPLAARPLLQDGGIDLLFLDIRMPGITGLELLKSLSVKPATIITTAYPEHALEGFELDVIDYLVKPVSYARFLNSLDKARRRLEPASSVEGHVVLKADKVLHRLAYEQILYAEAMGDYSKIFTTEGRLVVKETLGALLQRLPESFFRCHRSYLVNMAHVRQLSGNRILLSEGEVPVGAAFKAEFLERLG
ncbi:MAG: LytTR family DNA-binding domain-containing protein [Bacteroidia bacterium]